MERSSDPVFAPTSSPGRSRRRFARPEVRYNLVGGQSYFDRREIRDFVSYLKLFLNPDDDTGLLRIANVPARGLSNATMEKLLGLSQERDCTVFAAMRDESALGQFKKRTVDSILDFVELVETVNERLNRPIAVSTGEPAQVVVHRLAR